MTFLRLLKKNWSESSSESDVSESSPPSSSEEEEEAKFCKKGYKEMNWLF
jgi:hypothetical protein